MPAVGRQKEPEVALVLFEGVGTGVGVEEPELSPDESPTPSPTPRAIAMMAKSMPQASQSRLERTEKNDLVGGISLSASLMTEGLMNDGDMV